MDLAEVDNNLILDKKIALITGAARGIGKAISILFAEKGAVVALVDILKEVEETASSITSKGGEAHAFLADVTNGNAIREVIEEIIREEGKIEILINNAGVSELGDAENISEEAWDKVMAVNLKAPFRISQMVGLEMIKRKSGKIINIASQAAIIALDKHLAYSTSKAAILGMTKVLALEWAEYNINVNAISPTVVLTELAKIAWSGKAGEEMKNKIPLKRFCQPEEIAYAALFLASSASDMITGANLIIDGGYTIQ